MGDVASRVARAKCDDRPASREQEEAVSGLHKSFIHSAACKPLDGLSYNDEGGADDERYQRTF